MPEYQYTTAAEIEGLGAQLQKDATEFENYCRQVLSTIKVRWLMYQDLSRQAKYAGLNIHALLGPDLAQQNLMANAAAERFARMVRGLDTEKLSLIWYSEGELKGEKQISLAVIRSEEGRRYLSGPLWPIIPVILKIGAAAITAGVTAGSFYLVDAWLNVRQFEAENARIQAETEKQLANTADRIAKTNPKEAAVMTQAIGRARSKAQKTSDKTFLDRIAGGVKIAGAGMGLGVLLALYFLQRGKK